MLELWETVAGSVRHRLGPKAHSDLLEAVRTVREQDGDLVVLVGTAVQRDWVSEQYLDFLAREVRTRSETPISVRVEVSPPDLDQLELIGADPEEPSGATNGSANGSSAAGDGATRREPLDPIVPEPPADPGERRSLAGLNGRYAFDTFVVGGSNEMATSAAMSVAARPGAAYNPLFIHGGVGLGKTHLLHAIGQKVLEDRPHLRVLYRSAEMFINDFMRALATKSMDKFRRTYRRDCDVLLVDDVQFLSAKERTQEEFFHTFEALKNSGRQIVLTSDCSPRDIPNLPDRLKSRFTWGLIVDIQKPSQETRVAIVHKKARYDGIDLPDVVAEYLAESFRGNIREMEGCLNRLGAFADFSRRPITLEFAREVLKDQLPNRLQPTSEDVIRAVAEHFGLRPVELKGRRRHRAISRPRQIAMWLCRKVLGKSYPEIGRDFGKDHSTVISACRKVDDLIEIDALVRTAVDVLSKRFDQN
jgi:chromosomal replication initiator protein